MQRCLFAFAVIIFSVTIPQIEGDGVWLLFDRNKLASLQQNPLSLQMRKLDALLASVHNLTNGLADATNFNESFDVENNINRQTCGTLPPVLFSTRNHLTGKNQHIRHDIVWALQALHARVYNNMDGIDGLVNNLDLHFKTILQRCSAYTEYKPERHHPSDHPNEPSFVYLCRMQGCKAWCREREYLILLSRSHFNVVVSVSFLFDKLGYPMKDFFIKAIVQQAACLLRIGESLSFPAFTTISIRRFALNQAIFASAIFLKQVCRFYPAVAARWNTYHFADLQSLANGWLLLAQNYSLKVFRVLSEAHIPGGGIDGGLSRNLLLSQILLEVKIMAKAHISRELPLDSKWLGAHYEFLKTQVTMANTSAYTQLGRMCDHGFACSPAPQFRYIDSNIFATGEGNWLAGNPQK